MDRIEEIESAVTALGPDDYRRFVEWFRALEQSRWNEQMDHDSVAGKLDFLFEEAERQREQGLLRPWPPKH